jgi:hypothetical protein
MFVEIIKRLESIYYYILVFFRNIFSSSRINYDRIKIPTIRSNDSGFEISFKLARIIITDPKNYYVLDFSNCSKLSHNGTVLLGGLINYIHNQKFVTKEIYKKEILWTGVSILQDTMSPVLVENLISNNFFDYFQNDRHLTPSKFNNGYTGYREHKSILDEIELTTYLENEWLSNDKLNLHFSKKSEIISTIIEIFMNAYGHGVLQQRYKKLGVYSCGEYDKREKKLHLSVLDFGIGIAQTVMKHSNITDEIEAMKWALIRGNSTNTDSQNKEIARGLGLALLADFVKNNGGELRIYTNSVRSFSNKQSSFTISNNDYSFPGTLVSITINCDDRNDVNVSDSQPPNFF